MNALKQFRHYLIALEKILVAASLFLLLALTLIQVVARNLFETGFPSLDIISRHLVLYIAFLGAALITEDQKHIKIDFLVHFISDKQKQMLIRPLSIMAAVICGAFAWHASRFWLDEWQYASSQDSWIAMMAMILPVGFALITLHFIMLALQADVVTELKIT
jgi:TRAP-type transport system small permease protein